MQFKHYLSPIHLHLCLCFFVLFNNCTVQKRHHRRGWYLSIQKTKHSTITNSKNIYAINKIVAAQNPVICSNNNNFIESQTLSEKTIFVKSVSERKIASEITPKIETDTIREIKNFKTDEFGNSKKAVFAFKLAIISFIVELWSLMIILLGLILYSELMVAIGALYLALLAFFSVPFLITILVMTKKESMIQKKKIGKIKLIKMLRSGDYKSNKAVFARKLFLRMCLINLLILLIIAGFGVLFANS